MKGLLCWLGMLSGSTTEPAPSTRCLLCLFLGCQETGVGTEGQLGGGGGADSRPMAWSGGCTTCSSQGCGSWERAAALHLPSSGSCCKMLPSVGFKVNTWCRGSPGSCLPSRGVCRGEQGGWGKDMAQPSFLFDGEGIPRGGMCIPAPPRGL